MAKNNLYIGQPGSSAAAVYTATNTRAHIFSASVCNSDASAYTLDVWLVPSGGSPSAANKIYDQLSVSAHSQQGLSLLINMTVPKGATLQMQASTAAKLTVQISGDES